MWLHNLEKLSNYTMIANHRKTLPEYFFFSPRISLDYMKWFHSGIIRTYCNDAVVIPLHCYDVLIRYFLVIKCPTYFFFEIFGIHQCISWQSILSHSSSCEKILFPEASKLFHLYLLPLQDYLPT